MHVSPAFLASSRHHCITAAPGGVGQAWRAPLPALVLFLQVFVTSADVKSSELALLNPTLLFAKEMLDREQTELKATSWKQPATRGIQEMHHTALKGKRKSDK